MTELAFGSHLLPICIYAICEHAGRTCQQDLSTLCFSNQHADRNFEFLLLFRPYGAFDLKRVGWGEGEIILLEKPRKAGSGLWMGRKAASEK